MPFCPLLGGPVVLYRPSRALRSADHERLVIPKSSLSSAGDRAFSIYTPKTWNSIPIDIDTVDIFKKKFKKYLFDNIINS